MIRLNASFRADMEWWHVFISAWNGISLMREVAPTVEIWSDASGMWGHLGNTLVSGRRESVARLCRGFNCDEGIAINHSCSYNLGFSVDRGYSSMSL